MSKCTDSWINVAFTTNASHISIFVGISYSSEPSMEKIIQLTRIKKKRSVNIRIIQVIVVTLRAYSSISRVSRIIVLPVNIHKAMYEQHKRLVLLGCHFENENYQRTLSPRAAFFGMHG